MLIRVAFVWVALVLGIWTASRVIPGVRVRSIKSLLLAGVAMGLVDVVLGPIVLVATFSFTVITLGLFAFVVNGGLVLVAAALVPGFDVDGLFPAVNTGLVLAAFALAGYLAAELYVTGALHWELVAHSTSPI